MLPVFIDDGDALPPTSRAMGPDSDAPGLLAVGGSINTKRIEEAYSRGIFPWFSPGQPVLWWSPDPRMVMHVAEFKLARSLRKTIKRFIMDPRCEIRVDSAFEHVIEACAHTPRDGQAGTWIVPEMVDAYTRWHQQGAAHSVETWVDGQLVGGLYGINLGKMFFGESMFAHQTDASKIALTALVALCRAHGIQMIDCQQNTRHLASLGAREITRAAFESHLAQAVTQTPPAEWIYHRAHWSHLDTFSPEPQIQHDHPHVTDPR